MQSLSKSDAPLNGKIQTINVLNIQLSTLNVKH